MQYPHEFNIVGNIFEAVKAAGGTTAWVDKHLVYDIARGKSGKGVDDLFITEVASVKVKTVDGYNAYDDGHWAAILNWVRKAEPVTRMIPCKWGKLQELSFVSVLRKSAFLIMVDIAAQRKRRLGNNLGTSTFDFQS